MNRYRYIIWRSTLNFFVADTKKAEHKPTVLHLTVYSSHTMPTLYSHVHQARIQEFTLVGAPWIGEGSGDRQGPQQVQGSAQWGALLQQTFFLLLNVSFPPCFLSPLLLSLSLSLSLFSFFFFFKGGARRGRPRLNPRLERG